VEASIEHAEGLGGTSGEGGRGRSSTALAPQRSSGTVLGIPVRPAGPGATGVPTDLAAEHPGLATYLAFVKPHIDVTFVLVAVTGTVLATAGRGGVPGWTLLGVVLAVAALSAGAESLTNVIDRDIDAVMPRTAGRALPTGRIEVRSAVALGVALSAAGLAIAAALGLFPFVFLLLALVDNVVVYSALTKRSTPWSVVLGAPVGSLVLWAGYTAVGQPLSGSAWLLGGMVAAWVPVHIWAIASRYRSDYARASVPMAPVVWSRPVLGLASLAAGAAMGALATGGILAIRGTASAFVAGPVALLSAAAAAGACLLPWQERLARPMIRLATAYLILVLLAAIGLAT
jgi:protoheme IX farnesyltransferase